MEVNLDENWRKQLIDELEQPYFKELCSYLEKEYNKYECYPKMSEIFSAFNYCSFNDVKVVIIGQDPYHGKGQAHGLSFSVNDKIDIPPSLNNIFKEIKEDIGGDFKANRNLSHWAQQGVLMLNAILTVRANEAGSHQKKGWEKFTNAVIQQLSNNKKGVVFLLWGGYAKKKGIKIDTEKHYVLVSGHPSPLSANRGYWFGNRHFSQTNHYLESNNQNPIKW